MKPVLIVVGDAVETLDTFYPYFRLQEDGFEPVVCGRERRRYRSVLHEQPEGWNVTRACVAAGKPVASVCHGIEILARAGCLEGKRVATVPKCRFDVEVCGARFVDEGCVVDGNLVTGRTYHDHGAFVGTWVRMLRGQ
ncbi:MAG: peptidase [bacterium]|nr:peptidase [bacterium]